MVLLCLAWSSLVLITNRGKNKGIRYAWVGIIALFLTLTSSYQGHHLYAGQSIIDGISLQKYFTSGILMFFAVSKQINMGKLSFQDIIDICFWCSCAHMAIYFLQYLLGPDHMFLSCYYVTSAMDSRVLRLRLYGECNTITFSLIFA